MTIDALDSYYKRMSFCCKKVGAYVESRDQINCADHGWVVYDLFLNKDGHYVRVCCRCAQMVFPEIKPAVPAEEDGSTVRCGEINCYKRAVPEKRCTHCKTHFCAEHMEQTDVCNACSEELEEDARDATAFHQC